MITDEIDVKDGNGIKKAYLISIIIIIVLFIVLYYLFTNITITLNGNNPLVLKYGDAYYENGFIATNGFGKDVSENVKINGIIDEYEEGYQTIEYVYKYGGVTKVVTREVLVLENPFKEYNFVVNGEKIVYVMENSIYEDLGAYVIKVENNSLFDNIEVNNPVNTKVPGEYEVIYTFVQGNDTMTRKRKVIVLANDEQILVSSDGKTATIKIDFSNIIDYQKTILPNGKETENNHVEFKTTTNGEYHFLVYSSEKQVLDKKVDVDVLSGSLKCIGQIKVSGTFLNIINNNVGISKIIWYVDNEKYEGADSIRINKIVKNATVDLKLNDGTETKMSCVLQDDLAYTFKYDEYNLKSYMSCNTYSPQDKIYLEGKLSKAISDAGYGTRAGVVEAARFLVGGLDYKVPYLGPKLDSSVLGVYDKVGLNIGQGGAWGCMVAGWRQGMDCTNFISWAYKQNGLYSTNFYDIENTYKTRSVVGNLQVGDFLLTPCETNCDDRDFIHIGIIIGIDDRYIYVAEATTGSIDAIVVSKYDKFNMPQKGKFSIAKFPTYFQPGNVTNMWMSS